MAFAIGKRQTWRVCCTEKELICLFVLSLKKSNNLTVRSVRYAKRSFSCGQSFRRKIVLEDLGYYVSRDAAFEPRKSKRTMSVFISKDPDVREFILTGEKWYDKRKEVGGGGAIDLVMHLEGLY